MKQVCNFLNAIAYCLFPLLLYYVLYEAAGYVLYLAAASVASSGWVRAAVWTAAHAGDVSAAAGAAAMAAGFLAIHRTAAQEAPLTWKVSSCLFSTAAGALLALSSALFLNLVISMSGASASDAGASSAAAQTAAVSLPLGLVYYGILSPFIEETVFRGITFGRIRSVLRAAGEEGKGSAAKDAAPGEPALDLPKTAQARRYDIAAAVLSSLLFGIYHGNVVQGFYAFCMGMIFCFFRELTGSLAAAALLHGAVNAMTLLLSQSGVYAQLCTPAWLAAFLAIAVCSGVCLRRQ